MMETSRAGGDVTGGGVMGLSGDVPEGYQLCSRQQGFSEAVGPFFERSVNGEVFRGFLVRPFHCNPEGFVHGGMLGCLADFAMYQAAGDVLGDGSKTPTVSMTLNFLAAGRDGDWVKARSRVQRRTRSLLFLEVVISNDREDLVCATGVYKIVSS
jgi:uncharacterized protein (TIGR00369 family)